MTLSENDMAQSFNKFLQELDHHRKLIITSLAEGGEHDHAEAESQVRSLEDAQIVGEVLITVALMIKKGIAEAAFIENLFEDQFGPLTFLFHCNHWPEVIFLDAHIFPEKRALPLTDKGIFASELVRSYPAMFEDWIRNAKVNHQTSQNFIRTSVDLNTKAGELACHCQDCQGDFRTKIRDVVYKTAIDAFETAEKKAMESVATTTLSQISDWVAIAQKESEKALAKVRFKMRRGTLNKLQNQIKTKFKDTFYPESPLGQTYRAKIRFMLDNQLSMGGYKPELISDDIFDRFFNQLGKNLWRSEKFYIVEYERLIQSVLSLKRKDISSNILIDYLGQFWLHSEARKLNRKVIYHMGPTNSGKTYHAIQSLMKAETGCYLAPLRLLAAELYDTLNGHGVPTTLLTGEEVIENKDAKHISSTIEMARLQQIFDCAVIDEIQMITDPQRGWAWTRALVNIQAPVIHICGDPSVFEMVQKICDLCGDKLEIQNYERMTELKLEEAPITLADMEKGDALITFSRRNALKYKADLEALNFRVSIVYGRLSPEVRREQARKFDVGETDIIVATDAISMGMNLPIRRIVFSALRKFIDNQEYPLSNSEIKQISGRAGRFKRFPVGFVTCLKREPEGIDIIQEAIHAELAQSGKVMVGPDLDIFHRVNQALKSHNLRVLKLSEFLHLFNTMEFRKPFYCVDLKEMIELTEMVEGANDKHMTLSDAEIFGYSCAPVNLGLIEHVEYYNTILHSYVIGRPIRNVEIEVSSRDIDYLETSIKCVELYQWLSRHFSDKHFQYDLVQLLHNKSLAIERLNELLSEKIERTCASCGCKLEAGNEFAICEDCFKKRKFARRGGSGPGSSGGSSRFHPSRRPKSGGGGGGPRSGPARGPGGGGARPPKKRFTRPGPKRT